MKKKAETEAPAILNAIKDTIGNDHKVFVCCHAAVEEHFAGLEHGFEALGHGHWNAIDGRNDWKDFDTAVIFGLPYRDRIWSANVFMAIFGAQSTEWLNGTVERKFRTYRDIRKALEVGRLVVEIVQAINRVRSRRVIDADGNCAPVNVFVLLPDDETGQKIVEGIKDEMPEIKVTDWDFAKRSTSRRQIKRSNYGEALRVHARVMVPGRYSATSVRTDLRMSRATWFRLAEELRAPGSDLARDLAEIGVRYVPGIAGSAAYLTKD